MEEVEEKLVYMLLSYLLSQTDISEEQQQSIFRARRAYLS
jgi:hypothetical protein